MNHPLPNCLISQAQAAVALGVSAQTIIRYRRARKLTSYRRGRLVFVDEREVLALAQPKRIA